MVVNGLWDGLVTGNNYRTCFFSFHGRELEMKYMAYLLKDKEVR